jgi:hypothetical protein
MAAEFADIGERIHSASVRRAGVGNHHQRIQTGLAVVFDHRAQPVHR